jgi:hypothetical protein
MSDKWDSTANDAKVTVTDEGHTVQMEANADNTLGDNSIYFVAPPSYLGKQLIRYGGYLTFTVNLLLITRSKPSIRIGRK